MKTYTYKIADELVEIPEQEHTEILKSKKTFLLYTDTLALMEDILETREEKGLLLEAMYYAQTGQELPDMSEHKHVAAVFKQLSKNWDIDNEKYVKTTLKNRRNLNKRGAVLVKESNYAFNAQNDTPPDFGDDDEQELPFK